MKISRIGLALLFLAQLALFRQYAIREIVWAYPADFDQSSYLYADYSLYRDCLARGLFPAITAYLHQPHPTGWMLPLQDAVLHFFLGPGRLPDLMLNFSYFVLLEAIFFYTARWLTGRDAFGWLGVGLLMLQQTAFVRSGGMFDCRIDFIAYCLYGTFVCLMVRSDGLRETRWLAASGGCALLLVSFRFITLAYLIGFSLTLFTALLGLYLARGRRRNETTAVMRAMRRTAAFGLGSLACGVAVLALNWHVILNYYVVGHLTGNEKHIRAAEAGLSSLSIHLSYYFISLWRYHLGLEFNVVVISLAVFGLGIWFARWRRAGATGLSRSWFEDDRRMIQLLLVGASLFAPWFILTLDEAKSPVVANVLAAPAALLVVALVGAIERLPGAGGPSKAGTPLAFPGLYWAVAATMIFVLGAGNWLEQLGREGRFSVRRASVQQIGALYELLGDEARRLGFDEPVVATDVVYDWLQPSTIDDALYEHSGQWLQARIVLGGTIFAVTADQVFAALSQSDFVVLTDFPKSGAFPFYASIRPLDAEMATWCKAHLMRTGIFAVDGGQVSLYTRPRVSLEGLSGEWITPDGVRLCLPREVLAWMAVNGKTSLVMEGVENADWLPTPPTARAQVLGADSLPAAEICPALFTRPEPGKYRILLDLKKLLTEAASGADVLISLKLEGAFLIPKDIGIGTDTRHLVVRSPQVFRFE